MLRVFMSEAGAKTRSVARSDRGSIAVTVFNIGISVGLMVLLGLGYFAFGSRLALAQAADSLTDVLTAMTGDSVTLGLTNERAPMTLRDPDVAAYVNVIMPMASVTKA